MVKLEELVFPLSPAAGLYMQLNMLGTYCPFRGKEYRFSCRDPSVLPWVSQMEADDPCPAVDESCCAVCAEIFLTPVVLCCISCGRSFCTGCLEQFWRQHGVKECPFCFKTSAGLPHKSCEAHGERLLLLCVVDLEPVCCECRTSGLHINHIVYPIKEAFKDRKVSGIEKKLFLLKSVVTRELLQHEWSWVDMIMSSHFEDTKCWKLKIRPRQPAIKNFSFTARGLPATPHGLSRLCTVVKCLSASLLLCFPLNEMPACKATQQSYPSVFSQLN